MNLMLAEYLKTKRTIVIEGQLDRRANRAELVKVLNKAGYKSLLVWVQTDANEAHRRATKKYPKGSGLDSDEFNELLQQFQPPLPQEKPVVISGKHTYTTQVKIVLKQLAADNPRPAVSTAAQPKQTPPDTPRSSRNRSMLIR